MKVHFKHNDMKTLQVVSDVGSIGMYSLINIHINIYVCVSDVGSIGMYHAYICINI